MIVLQARIASTVLLSTIQRTTASSIPPAVPSIISRRLVDAVLRSQWPLKRLPLIPKYRQHRLQWCRSRSSWLQSNWHHIVFSNEFRFNLEAERVFGKAGKRSQSAFVQRHQTNIPGVMVWGSLS
ncbi:transposable element Tcb2 transposase [Trichonephila clavipes]|nr:transposable element Tcb2 transposase [Trichonephila clavipes]